jgi:hypothetical protein
MTIQPDSDLLKMLRADLGRIEAEHRDEELTQAALELKGLLLRRIANIEAAMKILKEIIAKNSGVEEP